MSEQEGKSLSGLHHPAYNDNLGWKKYWKARGQSWRTEPEIDAQQQEYLTKRLKIEPNIETGVYPFKGEKLDRADVEWLLSSHDNGNGLLEWQDESQGERKEVDLRGANLKDVDLSFLPLAKLIGGLMREDEEWPEANMEEQITRSQREMAAVQLQGAKLLCAQLQNAILVGAQMQ